MYKPSYIRDGIEQIRHNVLIYELGLSVAFIPKYVCVCVFCM